MKLWDERERNQGQDRGPAAGALQSRGGDSQRLRAPELKTTSPHPCPGESGRRVPGGGAARSLLRPSPSSCASSCASCVGTPRIRRHHAGARGRPSPSGKEPRCGRGVQGFRGSLVSAALSLLPPPCNLGQLAAPRPTNLDGTLAAAAAAVVGASAVRPRGISFSGGPREPPVRAFRSNSCRVDADNFAAHFGRDGLVPGAQSLSGSRPRLGPPSTGCTLPPRREASV